MTPFDPFKQQVVATARLLVDAVRSRALPRHALAWAGGVLLVAWLVRGT